MPTKVTRARMAHAQKQALRAHHASHSDLTQQELVAWAKTTFKLPVTPSRMTIWRILNGPVDVNVSNSKRKTKHHVSSAELKERLLLWIRQCEENKLPVVICATIRAKADKIRCELVRSGDADEAAKLQALVFSYGWLFKFQKCHGLTSKRVHGEAASVNQDAVKSGRVALQEITRDYERRDVFNMDETAFFFCATPVKSITKDRLAGRKQQKQRLAVAVCCNADGTTKIPLLFVGSVQKLRCFRGRSAEQLGLHYESTTKGWMTSSLFQRWLSQLNEQMRAAGCYILLLVDNISSHRLDVPLSNVDLQMLPPNTTAFLQTQDAGIISSFKAQIAKIQHRHVVDRFDELPQQMSALGERCQEKEIGSLFNVDVLAAMQWAEAAWSSVSCATISHCWRHTQILDEDIYELVESFDKLRTSALTLSPMLN